jgi:hypothetical protein
MSFLDNIMKMAGSALGNQSSDDIAKAVASHVGGMDPSELSGHLQEAVSAMDPATRQSLGQQLLQTFTQSTAVAGTGADAATAAGTTESQVAEGAPGALQSIIRYAQDNPQVLQAAATAFTERNPSALTQYAPGLLSGFLSKFTQK